MILKKNAVVISQPMYFPWVGMLEQIKLCDTYVHLNDVQYSSGGFLNRVQLKNTKGTQWMTVPLEKHTLKTNIQQIKVNVKKNWKAEHLSLLEENYKNSIYYEDVLRIANSLFENQFIYLYEYTKLSVEILADYFNLKHKKYFLNSEELSTTNSSSQRVLEICKNLKATTYITGHGAKNYLNHEIFDRANIDVQYMNYLKKQYPQLNDPFTPYVSALDLIANCGEAGIEYICSESIPWKKFLG